MRHPNRQLLPERVHRAKQFRTARLDLRLTVQDCAKLLRVSVRTVGNWESGETGIPHAAYKLMRVMRGGKCLGPAWHDFFVRGDTLVTPEGHSFTAGDLSWWSLLVRQAQAFRAIMEQQRHAAKAAEGRVGAGREATALRPSEDAHGAPVASEAVSGVGSALSIPPGHACNGKDPSPGHPERSQATSGVAPGQPQMLMQRAGGKDSKSLKAKGFRPEPLSLTIPVRLAKGAPSKTPKTPTPTRRKVAKAVRA